METGVANQEKCCVCGQYISDSKAYICEECEGLHHKKCSGDSVNISDESMTYENEYSYCIKCVKSYQPPY